ncbi:MAG: serine/threonine-protein kinase [Planctomycetota bacterium]
MTLDLPNYHVLEKLGVGAESRIFRAKCMRTGKDYAVKLVKLNKPEDIDFIELLRAEHAIGSAIQHPVLRKVFELRMIRQRFRLRGAVLFMEYVDGIPMSEKEFRRPMDEVLSLFLHVAEGLYAMHSAGYVHADLKPNNILVTPSNQVKLIDFGQSSKIHAAKPRIQGTLDYMAPEQVHKAVLDQRTDVFALGAVLHRLLTGRAVPTEMNQKVTEHSQHLVGKRVQEVREMAVQDLPIGLARFIDDCCHLRPENRIPDMPAVMERIRLVRTLLAKPLTYSTSDYDDDEFGDDLDRSQIETEDALESESLQGLAKIDLSNFDFDEVDNGR